MWLNIYIKLHEPPTTFELFIHTLGLFNFFPSGCHFLIGHRKKIREIVKSSIMDFCILVIYIYIFFLRKKPTGYIISILNNVLISAKIL